MCEPDNSPPRSFRHRAGLIAAALWLLAAVVTWPAVAAEIAVGPDRALKTLSAGVAAAQPHDLILLDPGLYVDDTAVIAIPLTIEGRAGEGNAEATTFRATRPIANRKGIIVAVADLTVRHVSFQAAQVKLADGGNGAGIVGMKGNLRVEDCIFLGNQNGILVYPNSTTYVEIHRSVFDGNGRGDGYTHAVYVNDVAALVVTGSSFNGTKVGHNIKSRALSTAIRDTLLEDGLSGMASYAVDLPNGGIVTLERLRIVQGPNTENPAMIAYGGEGNLKAVNSLTVSNSAFVNTAHVCGIAAIVNFVPSVSIAQTGNTYENVATRVRTVHVWHMIWTQLIGGISRWLGFCAT